MSLRHTVVTAVSKALKTTMKEADGLTDEVVGTVPLLWSKWDHDPTMFLVRLNDGSHLIVQEDTVFGSAGPIKILKNRIETYEKVLSETREMLRIAEDLSISDVGYGPFAKQSKEGDE